MSSMENKNQASFLSQCFAFKNNLYYRVISFVSTVQITLFFFVHK